MKISQLREGGTVMWLSVCVCVWVGVPGRGNGSVAAALLHFEATWGRCGQLQNHGRRGKSKHYCCFF